MVVEKLSKLGVIPSEVSDDATFLRRIYLDLTGTLPTPQEVRDFHSDHRRNKRELVIDKLLVGSLRFEI